MGVSKIDPQPWMRAEETVAVVRALTEGGGRARFVGGCVRDAVLARPIKDIDIATDAAPDRVQALMEARGFKVIPVGVDHGTVMAVVGGQSFEITTLRRDVSTDGRRAVVAFTDDWQEDAARRDLTMNALSLDLDGTVHDPFGGVADLRAGKVRFVGNADERIREDYLRLLRYFRFYAHYGRPPPDAAALEACRRNADGLRRLSAERVRAELLRLLAADDPVPAIDLMAGTSVLGHLLPGEVDIGALTRLVQIERRLGEPGDPVRRLAVLAHRDARTSSELAKGLRLSNAERDYLLLAAEPPAAMSPHLPEGKRRALLYRQGARTFRELVLLAWARSGAETTDSGWSGLLAAADGWQSPQFPLSGGDVLALGVPMGPRVGALLAEVEAWWIDNGFHPDRTACLAQLSRLAADSGC